MRQVEGFNHSTACTIWGDDGQGRVDGLYVRLPCSCGALKNWDRARAIERCPSLKDRGHHCLYLYPGAEHWHCICCPYNHDEDDPMVGGPTNQCTCVTPTPSVLMKSGEPFRAICLDCSGNIALSRLGVMPMEDERAIRKDVFSLTAASRQRRHERWLYHGMWFAWWAFMALAMARGSS